MSIDIQITRRQLASTQYILKLMTHYLLCINARDVSLPLGQMNVRSTHVPVGYMYIMGLSCHRYISQGIDASPTKQHHHANLVYSGI